MFNLSSENKTIMENYNYTNCKEKERTFTDAIRHVILRHPEQEMDILIKDKKCRNTKRYFYIRKTSSHSDTVKLFH